MARIVQGSFTVGGLPRNNATVKLWPGSAFSTVPAKNTAIPTSGQIASTLTGTSHGADGKYSFASAPSGACWASIEWNGLVVWDFHPPQASQTVIVLDDYGADSSGLTDSTAAIQAAVNLLQATTLASGQIELVGNHGTYSISGTINFPNSASNFRFRGSGLEGTIFKWGTGAPAGVPMFLLKNSRGTEFDHFGMVGNTANPPESLIEVRRAAGTVGSAGQLNNQFHNLFLAGDLSAGQGGGGIGIKFSADSGQDSNNDSNTIENCYLQNFTSGGVSLEHLNNEWNYIANNSFVQCQIYGINNVGPSGAEGGTFNSQSNRFSHCGTVYRLGKCHAAVSIFGDVAESCSGLISTPYTVFATSIGQSHYYLMGGSYKLTDDVSGQIYLDGNSNLHIDICHCFIQSPNGYVLSIPTAGPTVRFFGGRSVIRDIWNNGDLTLSNLFQGGGVPTYNNLGSGTLRMGNARQGAGTNDLLYLADTDNTNPIVRITSNGLTTISPRSFNNFTLTLGSTGSTWTGTDPIDTNVRIKCLGGGKRHGIIAYEPGSGQFRIAGSVTTGYRDAHCGLVVDGSVDLGGSGFYITSVIGATGAWSVTSIAAGATSGVTITVTGAKLGDPARGALNQALPVAAWQTAMVTAADQVTFQVTNNTPGALSLTAGYARVIVDHTA